METLYKKKALFVDRDGVIVVEGAVDGHDDIIYQIDSYEKIIYKPHVFEALREIGRRTDYELVMVSNQDGVGTPSYPYETYEGPAERIFATLRGEDIVFDDVNVDFSLPEDNCPGRKPGTAMLTRYMDGSYDLSRSFMIGDRLTDMMLAKALGAKGIWYTESKENVPEDLKDTVAIKTDSWLSIASFLTCGGVKEHRISSVRRTTAETDISLSVDLDGTGVGHIHTGIGFFDHMLDQVVKHSRCDISGDVKGDTEVDEHHSAEDTALALGSAFLSALGDKRGIERYGFEIVMMDDVAATVAVDFSGRDELIYDVEFTMDYVGSFPTELIRHFFRSFSSTARCNIYISATKGGNSHHTAEAIFKAFARALRKAVRRIPGDDSVSSTKGVL